MSRLPSSLRELISRLPNPFRALILYIGFALARAGLIDRHRVVRTTDLAWPRIVTGIARMSKNAVDVAMVGVAVGTSAVAGVGFAGPYWGLAFALGGGVAGGTIALVSQRYSAEAFVELGDAVRSSVLLVIAISVPVSGAFWLYAPAFIDVLSSNEAAIAYGADYLRVVGLGVPFAALNLVGSRVLVGCDDAYTAMQVRAGGALANIVLSALFIFGFGWGVEGAAVGTVLSNVLAVAGFTVGLVRGSAPLIGEFPVEIDATGSYLNPGMLRDLVEIGVPVGARNLVWTAAEFPMLAILDVFGENTVAAFVIARRIWGIMNTPGWGFGLASSSLVGQELGVERPDEAEAYARDIIRFSVATYAVSAVLIATFATDIVSLFANSPDSPEIPIAVKLVYAACAAVIFQGVSGGAAGPLDAAGDTKIPFASQFLGMFCVSIPLAYVGAHDATPAITIPDVLTIPAVEVPLVGFATPLVEIPFVGFTLPQVALPAIGLWGLYLAFMAETTIPAAINYLRFRSGKWKKISEAYRPEATADD
ncbi:MATE efflux family protein [Halorubrum distributum JCM 13561]|uniref:MATE efflux family protein n=1 Tax=Halorubrum distributum JCM 13561 TaxID=1227483 RepID=M0P2N4_9EURY|nr:MATE family efflux transporter [Halorubrum litoreum]EMA64083.1 MATE efflux family protein [Halorubrum litoreum JCM 13561]